MKFLGLDVGERRVGLAFGDSALKLATPVGAISRQTADADAGRIAEYVREYDAGTIVVGLPRNMDGTTGFQAVAVTQYAEQLGRAVGVPVVFWDERLTTVEAARRREQREGSAGTGRKAPRARAKSRGTLDALAAAVILQDYMDSQGNPGA